VPVLLSDFSHSHVAHLDQRDLLQTVERDTVLQLFQYHLVESPDECDSYPVHDDRTRLGPIDEDHRHERQPLHRPPQPNRKQVANHKIVLNEDHVLVPLRFQQHYEESHKWKQEDQEECPGKHCLGCSEILCKLEWVGVCQRHLGHQDAERKCQRREYVVCSYDGFLLYQELFVLALEQFADHNVDEPFFPLLYWRLETNTDYDKHEAEHVFEYAARDGDGRDCCYVVLDLELTNACIRTFGVLRV